MTEPTYRHGKICYLMMPSRDVEESARFYSAVFAWNVRQHPSGETSFDDSVGQVSGMWLPDREAVENPGVEIHIMVADADEVERAIVQHGGSLVWKSGPDDAEAYGTFRDPTGNLLGYYQQAGLKAS